MAALTTQQVTAAGLTPTLVAAGGSGDTFQPGPHTYLRVDNANGSSINVTVTSTAAARAGLAPANQVVAVANNVSKLIWVDPAGFADANGTAAVAYSATSSVTVAVVQV